MRHNRIAVGLIILALAAAGVRADLANEDLRGLRVHTTDGVLRLEPDQIDIGTAALIISRQWGTQKTLHTYRGKIDAMAETILKRLAEQEIPADYRAIPVINDYLFGELGFRTVETADDPEDLFLHVVLDRKRGYCLSLSVLYLAIGERLGMPLYGVVVPGHFFVRYDDGTRQYNIETTAGGGIASDDHYIEKFSPPKDHSLYLKNLNPRQSLGCFFNNLGNSYSAVGQIDQAYIELSRAVQINPTLAEARINLGNICLQKGMASQAVEQYEFAQRILPNDPRIHNNLGTAWLEQKQYKKAQAALYEALNLDPAYHDARRVLARALREDGRVDKALAEMKTLAEMEPDNPDNYFLLGRFHHDGGDPDEASRQYLRALRYRPDYAEARIALGQAYSDMDRPAWAIDAFNEALKFTPNDVAAWFGLARAYDAMQRVDDEIWAYQQLLAIEPDTPAAIQNLGNALIQKDRVAEAIEWYLHGLELDPRNTSLRYNLGVAYAKLEQYEPAQAAYQAVLDQEPDSAAAHHGLAVCAYYLKKPDLMRKHARRAKALGFDVQEVLLK